LANITSTRETMQTPAALTLQLFEKLRIDLQVINKTLAEPSSYLIGAATNGSNRNFAVGCTSC